MLEIFSLYDYPVESYKGYKNRTFAQHIDKASKQLWQIKQSSLKKEDKEKCKQDLIEFIKNFDINF